MLSILNSSPPLLTPLPFNITGSIYIDSHKRMKDAAIGVVSILHRYVVFSQSVLRHAAAPELTGKPEIPAHDPYNEARPVRQSPSQAGAHQ
ncbi:hypothetical protein D3C74_74720 [compost metagenome]